MKNFTKNLRWLFMSLLLVVGGNAWASEETVTFSEQGYENSAAVESYTGTDFTITFNKGTNNNAPKYYTTGAAIRIYGGGYMTISSEKNITSIVLTFGNGDGSNAITTDAGTYENGTWTGSAASIKFTVGGTSGQRRIASVKVTTESGDTPSKTATTTTFIDGKESYSITEGESFTAPTATVTAGETTLANATITYSSSEETVATVDENGAVTIKGVGTTTIKATYESDDTYYGSTASYSLTVVSASIPSYSSLKELQENTTSTSTDMKLTLTNVYVTAVKGSNAYLSDGTYGALVYTSNHGLTAGQKLNGTITAKSVLYRGQTEITNFSTEGLTITEEALAAKEVTDLSTITAANQSLLVTLKNVTYDGSLLKDASGNTITPYSTFVSNLGLESGTSYDITGIVILYNTTLEIAPRTADDIVALTEPTQKTDPESTWAVTEPVSVDLSEGIIKYTFATNSDGTISYSSSNEAVATIDKEGTITLKAAGSAIITAVTAETETYNSSEASFTLTVTDNIIIPDWALTDNYTFTSKSWGATINELEANWTSQKDGAGYNNNGVQVTTTASGASAISPVSYSNVYKVIVTYNTNAIRGAGKVKIKIGDNDAVSKSAEYNTTLVEEGNNGTNSFFKVEYGYKTPQTGEIAITVETSTNSLYICGIDVIYEDKYCTATIASAGYTTFCPDYNVSVPEAITAYTVSAINNGYATLTEVSTIKAGTPVVLKGEAGEYALPIIEDAEEIETNFLKVSDGKVKGAANIYALANKNGVGFYPVSSEVTIPAGKCYIETSAGDAAKERIDFDFSGTTAIEAIAVENAISNDVIYNLNGQRVMNPTKGIFIKNGKKVFIR